MIAWILALCGFRLRYTSKGISCNQGDVCYGTSENCHRLKLQGLQHCTCKDSSSLRVQSGVGTLGQFKQQHRNQQIISQEGKQTDQDTVCLHKNPQFVKCRLGHAATLQQQNKSQTAVICSACQSLLYSMEASYSCVYAIQQIHTCKQITAVCDLFCCNGAPWPTSGQYGQSSGLHGTV